MPDAVAERGGVPPQAVPLEQHATARQLAERSGCHGVRRWRRQPAGLQGRDDGMLGERIGRSGEPGGGAVDDGLVERLQDRPLALVRARRARAPRRGGGAAHRWPPWRRRDRRPSGRSSGARRSPVSASSSSASTHPRSSTTRSTARSGRARDAGRTGATSSTSPPPTVSSRPALAQHVAVAGQERQGGRQVEADGTRAPRPQRLGTEHPQADGVLARPDVGEVGAPPRDVVVERGRGSSATHPGVRSAATARR